MTQVASLYEGAMDHAYKILPHSCLISYFAIKHKGYFAKALSVIGFIYILMLGTRGAAVFNLFSILITVVLGNRSKGVVIRTLVLSSAIFIYILSPLFETSMMVLYTVAERLGLSVRIFNKIVSGGVFESQGRANITNQLLDAIKRDPIIGYGLCGDRTITGSYAHNIALELCVEFGVIAGTIILAWLLHLFFDGYMSGKGDEKGLMLTLFISTFLHLFISGSYLNNNGWVLLVGLSVGIVRKQTRRSQYSSLCLKDDYQ